MNNLPRVSIIVPTRDRPKDLADLLLTIINQTYPPREVIIVDDSPGDSTKQVVDSFSSKFKFINCRLKYAKGSANGLPAARNLGVKLSNGDAVLFLDDDTLLGRNVIGALATFLRDNPAAVGVQPKVLSSMRDISKGWLVRKFENAVYKALMLSYHEKNRLKVRRSGASVFPNNLTKVIRAQRLSGCCCCYRHEIFGELSFDTNLKRWGFMEDLDFSYRVYKRNPRSLYVIPHAKIIHKASGEARLPTKLRIYMTTIYRFYVFFKDIFAGSILNLTAFLWALTGNLLILIGGLVVKNKPKYRWWELVYLIESYFYAFKHLKEIKKGNLDFFNKQIKEVTVTE
jgi:GT2 family glycosyltransferase